MSFFDHLIKTERSNINSTEWCYQRPKERDVSAAILRLLTQRKNGLPHFFLHHRSPNKFLTRSVRKQKQFLFCLLTNVYIGGRKQIIRIFTVQIVVIVRK